MSTPGPLPLPEGAPPSPRSPRPTGDTSLAAVPTVPPGAALPVFMAPPGPPPRPNIGSMLLMTAFFFFMSGGNNTAVSPIVVGPDGEIVERVTELGMAGKYVQEYKGFLNGTGNWTEPLLPILQPSSLIPPEYTHSPSQDFFTNISGFYRDARLHPVDLVSSHQTRLTTFFDHVEIPSLNSSTWNETQATELRGDFPWSSLVKWDMNLKERIPEANASILAASDDSVPARVSAGGREQIDWNWVKGVATLTAADDSAVDYNLFGLHYVPNGTYSMFGLPDGMRIDIRHIPTVWPDHLNTTRAIILAELEKELSVQQESLYLSEVRADDETTTRCPLLVHLTVPPLPVGTSTEVVEMYESEMHDPTGIRLSLPRPPNYWEGRGIGGVVVADQCGWAFGLEGGKGVKIEEFWSRSINYAAFATVSQLLVLVLLVRQMESTRTPSTLAKVSLWSIVIMGITDSWIFSAHVVVGIMSENRTSLPMLVPGFLCLCSAIVFGPRYAVLLHRIQAPERNPSPPAMTPLPSPTLTSPAEGTTITPIPEVPRVPLGERIAGAFERHPKVQLLIGGIVIIALFQFVFLPPLIPFFLFVIYSFWVPQIWRNARRGNGRALDHTFVFGTSIGRLALPLYAFSYEENVFFIQSNKAVWGLVLWQVLQIMMLLAQERFGPAFFLPKSFAPAETYNYHPLLPSPDAENGIDAKEEERTCSICMEEVDTRPGPSGEVLLGMNPRRGYALAPCHHLFHTKCLSQWLAIKVSLCRSRGVDVFGIEEGDVEVNGKGVVEGSVEAAVQASVKESVKRSMRSEVKGTLDDVVEGRQEGLVPKQAQY